MDYLIGCAQEAWETLKEEMLNTLTSGMQKRVDAVKAAKWGGTQNTKTNVIELILPKKEKIDCAT